MAIDSIETLEPDVYSVKDYKSGVKPTWCPGCGDFGVLSATYKAFTQLQLKRHDVMVVSGIGCSSRIPYFMSTYGVHGVHGRAVPLATGVKLARPDLTVVAMGGDGDLMSIGAGHMPHAAARNVDITVLLMDNQTYGLTHAQASPTSNIGHVSRSTPYGDIVQPMQPTLLALAYGATFVARGYSARANQLAELLVRGIQHKGFAFIHVQSPCTEFHNTFDYFDQSVEEMPEGWDEADREGAIRLALTEDRVHLGVFYEEARPAYDEQSHHLVPEQLDFDVRSYLERFA